MKKTVFKFSVAVIFLAFAVFLPIKSVYLPSPSVCAGLNSWTCGGAGAKDGCYYEDKGGGVTDYVCYCMEGDNPSYRAAAAVYKSVMGKYQNTCYAITNNCATEIFIPNNSLAEFEKFYNNHPSCISVSRRYAGF